MPESNARPSRTMPGPSRALRARAKAQGSRVPLTRRPDAVLGWSTGLRRTRPYRRHRADRWRLTSPVRAAHRPERAISSALRKAMAALPPHRDAADLVSRRILVDSVRWPSGSRPTTGLSVLQHTIFTNRRLRLSYRHGHDDQVRSYTLDPATWSTRRACSTWSPTNPSGRKASNWPRCGRRGARRGPCRGARSERDAGPAPPPGRSAGTTWPVRQPRPPPSMPPATKDVPGQTRFHRGQCDLAARIGS